MTETPAVAQDFVASARAVLTQQIEENNKRAERIRNAGNESATIAEFRDSAETKDATVLAYRAAMEQANAQILQWQSDIEKYIRDSKLVDLSDVDVEAETAAWKAQNATVKAMTTVLVGLGGEEATKDLPEVRGIPGTRSGSSGGTSGIRRPRFQSIAYALATDPENWVDVHDTKTVEGETVEYTNLTILGQVLSEKFNAKVVSSDLQGPLFSEAGTQDLSTLNGKPVTFGFTAGETNLLIKVTPRVA